MHVQKNPKPHCLPVLWSVPRSMLLLPPSSSSALSPSSVSLSLHLALALCIGNRQAHTHTSYHLFNHSMATVGSAFFISIWCGQQLLMMQISSIIYAPDPNFTLVSSPGVGGWLLTAVCHTCDYPLQLLKHISAMQCINPLSTRWISAESTCISMSWSQPAMQNDHWGPVHYFLDGGEISFWRFQERFHTLHWLKT